MTDVQSLQDSIDQYEKQLSQVQLALSATAKGPDLDNLLSLQSDIQELITLTKESLKSARADEATTNEDNCPENLTYDNDDPMAREYAIFKAELEQTSEVPKLKDDDDDDSGETSNDIEDELRALEGMKCRAPHGSSWGGTGYHNAMVSSIHRNLDEQITTINDIRVRVLFVNPTHREMLPCPYYLDGACKFSDEQCHYSHGEVVPLSSLREYIEPVYTGLKMGSRVLAKEKNNLWHRCVILKLPEKLGDDYRIKFESSGKISEIAVQDLLPLDDADLEMSDSSDESDCELETSDNREEALIHRSLLTMNTSEPLGNWEQHTRGIGSKLMAQMGYVHGTGLGKRADGRVAPVEATVLPAGKSLDHCMELREHAGGDKDLFSAERKMRKQRLKMEQQREKQYLREKAREKSNVFNFINTTLGNKTANDNEPSSSKGKGHFKAHTNRGLNVASFEIDENITRLERESSKLMDSLVRHSKGSLPYKNIVLRYTEKQNELAGLRSTLSHIASEQNQRKDKAKLSVF